MSLLTGLININQVWFWVYKLSEMMSQGYETMVVNFSLQAVIRWRGYWRMWKQSWHRRTSVSLGGRDKQKTTSSVYWSHKRSIIESTLKQITRIWANWYRVDISNYVLDTMAFYCTIWKKNEMSKWHTYCIRDSQILEKENNRLHIMLTCKAYCKRKQRHSSLLQIISLQHMSHISAYVINCILLFCIRFCNSNCTLAY